MCRRQSAAIKIDGVTRTGSFTMDDLQMRNLTDSNRMSQQVLRLTAETALTKVQAELGKLREYQDGRQEREDDYKIHMDEEHRYIRRLTSTNEGKRLLYSEVPYRDMVNYFDNFKMPCPSAASSISVAKHEA